MLPTQPLDIDAAQGRQVWISDVFPRDGIQSLGHVKIDWPATLIKIEIIAALDRVGVPEIEITGFAHPSVIPTLSDADAVAKAVVTRPHAAVFRALVPNLRGAERAIATGLTKIKCVVSATEQYQLLNANRTIHDTLDDIERTVRFCRSSRVVVALGIGNSFVCPYEGVVPEQTLVDLIERMVDCGITEITLADSLGLAWPSLVRDRCEALLARWPQLSLGLHLHTLAGLALVNAYVARQIGVRRFDAAVGGIGGGIAMPVHRSEMANVATEDLVYMFEACGYSTGIDQRRIGGIGTSIRARFGEGSSHVAAFGSIDALLRRNRRQLARMMARRPGAVSTHRS